MLRQYGDPMLSMDDSHGRWLPSTTVDNGVWVAAKSVSSRTSASGSPDNRSLPVATHGDMDSGVTSQTTGRKWICNLFSFTAATEVPPLWMGNASFSHCRTRQRCAGFRKRTSVHAHSLALCQFSRWHQSIARTSDVVAWFPRRGTTQVGHQLVLMVDRFDPESFIKCHQFIDFDSTISFPCFIDTEGTVRMDTFAICGVIFHLGVSPCSGHYRAALRYQKGWLIYDDNKIPDRVEKLPMEVHRNCTMFWLNRPTPHTVRTMEEADPRLLARNSSTGNVHRMWRRRTQGPYTTTGASSLDATWLN